MGKSYQLHQVIAPCHIRRMYVSFCVKTDQPTSFHLVQFSGQKLQPFKRYSIWRQTLICKICSVKNGVSAKYLPSCTRGHRATVFFSLFSGANRGLTQRCSLFIVRSELINVLVREQIIYSTSYFTCNLTGNLHQSLFHTIVCFINKNFSVEQTEIIYSTSYFTCNLTGSTVNQ